MRPVASPPKIFLKLKLLYIRAQIEYPADFWLGIAGLVLMQIADFVLIWAVFTQVPALAGWNIWEAALLYALLLIPTGLHKIFFAGAWLIPTLVRMGRIDVMKLRPIPVLLQLMVKTEPEGIGSIALGIVIIAVASSHLGLSWSLSQGLVLAALCVNGLFILAATSVAANSIGFWEQSGDNTFAVFVTVLGDAARIPLSVFGGAISFFLTWIVPYAFVNYYPTCWLLGKEVSHPWIYWILPFSGLGFFSLALLVWRAGLKRYEGTGH